MSELCIKAEQWSQEIQDALRMAVKLLEEDKHQPLLEEHKSELFKYAPVLAAYNRGIRDEIKVAEMAKFAFKRRMDNIRLKSDCVSNDEINFYIAYLDAHIVINELNMTDIDSIMEYLIQRLH